MQKKYKTNKHPVFSSLHVGAAAVAALAMFGVAEISNFNNLQHQMVVSQEGLATLEAKEEEEKKTMRMPVRYEDGLRPVTIGGS